MYLLVLILFSLTCKTYFICWNPIFDNSTLKKQEGNRAERRATINSGIVTRDANLCKSKIWRLSLLPYPYSLLPNVNRLPLPRLDKSTQPPPWEWLRTLYEVLHAVDTFQICNQHFNNKKIFVSD